MTLRVLRTFLVLILLGSACPHAWCADAPPTQTAAAAEPAAPMMPPGRVAYAAMEEALGQEGLKILSERGIVLLSDRKKTAQVLHVQWQPLEALCARAKDLSVLLTAAAKLRAGEAVEGDAAALRRIERMSEAGLATAGLRAAAGLLAGQLENSAAMSSALKGSSQKPLPALSWGADFWARTHGDVVADFSAAATSFFREFLLGPQRNAEAQTHYLAHQKEVRGADEAAQLQKDLTAGAPSQRTLDAIAEYLADQRRLWNASLGRERLLGLEKDTTLRKDLQDLSVLLPLLQSGPDIVRALRFALQGTGPEPRERFSTAELHVHLAAGEEPFDIEDEAVVSLAYWIEGISPRESVEVAEVGFLDEGEGGAVERSIKSVRRSGGGPHTLSLRLPLNGAGRKTYRFILATPEGASARRSIEFQVSPRLGALRAEAAEAEHAALLCRLDDADRAFASLESRPEASDSKPAFKTFLSRVKARRKLSAEHLRVRNELAGLLDGARLHAGKEQCDFRSDKARKALALLASLPAGCDRALDAAGTTREEHGLRADLEGLLRATDVRRANQEAFRAELARARKLEAACSHEEAAQAYASALALLDSDGEARCGAWEADYTSARLQDLPRAGAGKALADEIAAIQERAERRMAEKDPSGALALLTPLIARIDTLESRRCYQPQRRRAEEAALAAGLALAPAEPALVRGKLPKDSPEDAVRSVSAERDRMDRIEAERREREAKRQEPSVRSFSEDLPANPQGDRP